MLKRKLLLQVVNNFAINKIKQIFLRIHFNYNFNMLVKVLQIRAKITKLDDFNLCKDPQKEDLAISLSS